MKKWIPLFLVCSLVLFAGACSKKKDLKPEDSVDGEVTDVSDEAIDSGRADSDSGNAMGIQTIYFPFDSFEIAGEQRKVLEENIAIMKGNPSVKVQIEGHCDERGGIQYNLALGEKRSAAIQAAMVAGGVSKSRITTISMGKEKPAVPGSGEEAWAKNRRGNFVITEK